MLHPPRRFSRASHKRRQWSAGARPLCSTATYRVGLICHEPALRKGEDKSGLERAREGKREREATISVGHKDVHPLMDEEGDELHVPILAGVMEQFQMLLATATHVPHKARREPLSPYPIPRARLHGACAHSRRGRTRVAMAMRERETSLSGLNSCPLAICDTYLRIMHEHH